MVDPDSVTELTNLLIKKDDEISQLKAQVEGLVVIMISIPIIWIFGLLEGWWNK